MKLSTRSRYGLRALVALARHEGLVVPAERLAGEEGVSKKYLDSILAALRRAGLIEAVHGAAGGYRLTRPAAEVTAADAVTVLEDGFWLVPCVECQDECDRVESCPTRDLWVAVTEAVRKELASVSIAELATRSKVPLGEDETGLEGGSQARRRPG